jgi:hypothetical protein
MKTFRVDVEMGWSNKPDAENPARASRLANGCYWRGVSDPFRWYGCLVVKRAVRFGFRFFTVLLSDLAQMDC